MLGLALLGACAGDPTPGPLMVGGRLSTAFTQLARAGLQTSFPLAPTIASVAPPPSALTPPVPVPRPRLVVARSLFPPPRNPVTHERIAWLPQPKPERRPLPRIASIQHLKPERPAPEPPAGSRIAIWPPPWQPDQRLAIAPAAGPTGVR